ncbi:MAG: hypothetical protein NT133_14225 [Alphaproteobacteria bacterium]|nr:hypothetical protein [Alphaproteobacteria bacterium]
MSTKRERRLARECGVSVRDIQEVEERLRKAPMQPFLDALFGPGIAVYDPEADLWIAPDPKYSGPGFGFIAVRPDKSFFTGVVPTGAFN